MFVFLYDLVACTMLAAFIHYTYFFWWTCGELNPVLAQSFLCFIHMLYAASKTSYVQLPTEQDVVAENLVALIQQSQSNQLVSLCHLLTQAPQQATAVL